MHGRRALGRLHAIRVLLTGLSTVLVATILDHSLHVFAVMRTAGIPIIAYAVRLGQRHVARMVIGVRRVHCDVMAGRMWFVRVVCHRQIGGYLCRLVGRGIFHALQNSHEQHIRRQLIDFDVD